MWKKIRPTLQNAAAQASFWGVYCAMISYASVYLKSRGMNDGEIGLVLALGNTLSVVLQPIVGNFADGKPRMILRGLLAACILPMLGLYAALLAGAAPAVCFVLLIALLQTVLPLLYSLCTFYMDRGVGIQFGISRGIGSLGYALISTVLGQLVSRLGPEATLIMGAALLLCLLASVVTYRFRGVSDEKPVPEKSTVSMSGFLKGNRRFLLLLAGIMMAFVGYNAIGNFLFQILSDRGMGAQELGYCLTVSSTVELPTLFLLSFLNRRFYSGRLLKVSAFFMMFKAIMMALVSGLGGVLGVMSLQILGYPLFAGVSVVFVNQVIDENHRALGQSLMNAAVTLGNVIACLLGGWLIDATGVRTMQMITACISAAGVAVVAVSAQRGKKMP